MTRSGHRALHIDTKDRSSSVFSMPRNASNYRPFHTYKAQTCANAPIHFICGTTLGEGVVKSKVVVRKEHTGGLCVVSHCPERGTKDRWCIVNLIKRY